MSFFGINLASRSLQAQQRALEVTGQNIANVDTPGYSRQVAVLSPVPGVGSAGLDRSGNPLAPGGGVDAALVQRTHAAWLDRAAGSLEAQVGQTSYQDRAAQQVEGLLQEPGDTGLATTLDRFFSAFGNLATNANDPAARDGVLRAGTEVANRFRELGDGLDALRQGIRQQAQENVDTINHLAEQVGALSHTIAAAQAAGNAPNELLDQRDQLIAELSRRAGVTVSGQEGGAVVVSLSGMTLVEGEHVNALDLAPGDSLSVVMRGTGAPVTPPGGELRAEQEWNNTVLPGYATRLATVRADLAAAVNALHQSGQDRTGAAGEAFFVTDADGNLAVNPDLQADNRKVVAGDGTAGDGSVARAISDLGGSTSTILTGYRALVAQVGADRSDNQRQSDQAQASRQLIAGMQASESGVNLDEELAQMVTIQHAYAASARLLSTYNDMLGTLIERTGT